MNTPKNQINELGLIVGFEVENWQGSERPNNSILKGQHCTLEPLHIGKHSADLFTAYKQDKEGRNWVYLPYGPFEKIEDFCDWMKNFCVSDDPFFYAIVDNQTQKPIGVASYLRITPAAGSIEVGHIHFSPALQGTVAATEAMYLMMENVFNLGYRRYEWKCNALNEKSCNAAKRLGFTYEGTFRQMMVVRGQNRDTAWFSCLDREWPLIQSAFKQWLSLDNFDSQGKQKEALSSLTKRALASAQ